MAQSRGCGYASRIACEGTFESRGGNMATPEVNTQQLQDEALTLRPEEKLRLKKRRQDVKDYDPPKWTSSQPDPVSGQLIERPMVPHANIVFIGPTGSGKSSLIGSLVRAVMEAPEFPARIQMTLNHPGEDSHGTIMWLETQGNRKESIVYQDTRGDQEYDPVEQSIHEFELQGMYRDGAELKASTFFSKDWWLSRRFFWERSLAEVPHCVVFVFDGSSDPFLDQESLEFFQQVFKDCTNHGYEPIIVVTCLDLIHQKALRHGFNFEVEVGHKKDKVLQVFEDLNLTRQSIYFVTNFHEGRRGVKVWGEGDRGFEKATKCMVDLARDMLTVADRFIKRVYTNKSRCCVL